MTNNNVYAVNAMNPKFMINPTPKSDIRKVELKDGILNPLIEEHKRHSNAQVTLFG